MPVIARLRGAVVPRIIPMASKADSKGEMIRSSSADIPEIMDPEKDPLAWKEPEVQYAKVGRAMDPQPTVEVMLIENPLLKTYTTVTHEGTQLMVNHFEDELQAMSFVLKWMRATEDFEVEPLKFIREEHVRRWTAKRL